MFNIDTVLNDNQVGKVIEQISTYDHECNDVFLNLLQSDQQEYIKVLIEINSQKHLSKCQKKIVCSGQVTISKIQLYWGLL